MGNFKLKNEKGVNTLFKTKAQQIENALVYLLEYMVADLENHAKLNAAYKDQTSNLKSSIGGVVLKDGKPISYKGFNGVGEGSAEGMNYIKSLFYNFQKGFVVLLVAGMEYAVYVEEIRNLNVLKESELKMKMDFPKMLAILKNKIDKSK